MIAKELLHFFVIPIILGIIGGFSAFLFRMFVKFFASVYELMDVFHSAYFYLLTMPILFFVSNFLISKLLINQSNVTIDNIAKKISLMSGKFSFFKGYLVLVLTSVSIGFGVPVGREGPIAKLGGLVSEIFLLATKIEKINLPIYLSAGVSAAIAATFNAPIAGIIFGIEIIIGKINSYIIIPLVVSCATATFIAREFIGNFTAFYVPHLSYDDSYFFYIPLEALFFSAVSIFLFFSLKRFRILRVKYRKHWSYIVVVLGLLVGFIIVLTPQIKGVGYEYISGIFQGGYSSFDALLIMLSKLLGVILSIGSGIFGGLMSPTIFIGAFGGYWFGGEFLQYGVDPRVFALIGSAAMLSGISKAPLRSSIIITELTHSYQLLLPILITSSITAYILSKMEAGSYFKRSLIQKGIDIDNKTVENYLQNCDLSRFVQNTSPLKPDTPLKSILRLFRRLHVRYLPVVKDDVLVGIVSLRDVRKRYFMHRKNIKALDIMTHEPFSLNKNYSKEDIFKALSILNVNYIPYVQDDKKYIGMLDLNKLLKDLTLTQKSYMIK